MATWIALLRAVNVGKRQYPMAQLREALGAAGFTGVQTHIQTGNVVLDSTLTDRVELTQALENVMLADRGFEVPVVLLSPEELSQVAREARQLSDQHGPTSHYIAITAQAISEPESVTALSPEGEVVVPGLRAVHLLLNKSFHEAKTTLPMIEKVVGVATVRNLNVTSTLAAKWGA